MVKDNLRVDAASSTPQDGNLFWEWVWGRRDGQQIGVLEIGALFLAEQFQAGVCTREGLPF